jgi:hypothetical protein
MHRLLKTAIQKVAIVQFRKTAYESYEGSDVVTKVPYNDDGRPTKPEYEKKSPPEKDMLGKSKKILDDVMSLPESQRQAAADRAKADFNKKNKKSLLYYLLLNLADVPRRTYLDILVLFMDENIDNITSQSILNHIKSETVESQQTTATYFMKLYFDKYKKPVLNAINEISIGADNIDLFIKPMITKAKEIMDDVMSLPESERQAAADRAKIEFLDRYYVSLLYCLKKNTDFAKYKFEKKMPILYLFPESHRANQRKSFFL